MYGSGRPVFLAATLLAARARGLATVWLVAAGLLALTSSPAYAGLMPLDVTPPSTSGSAQQAQTVTCLPGTWTGSPTGYAYSWQRDVTTSIGTSSSQYTLTAADVGHAITCAVVASNSFGNSLPAVSVPIVPVSLPVAAVPVAESPPVISGTAEQGQGISCSTGSWLNGPTAYSYSWQRDVATPIGAGQSTYALTAADVGHAITCTVIASNPSGTSAPAVSAPVVPVATVAPGSVPVATAPPSISGSALAGQVVTCSPGSWTGSPTSYSYAWERDAVALAGQTGSQYTLGDGDVGQALTCSVIAHNSSGDSLPIISLPIVPALAGSGGGGGSVSGSGSGSGSVSGSGSASPAGSGSAAGAPGGSGSGGGVKLHRPAIKSLSVNPRKLVVRARRRARQARGLRLRFTLDQRAGVLFEVMRRAPGRQQGGHCVAPTKRNVHAKRCTRWLRVRTFAIRNARAGVNALAMAARSRRGALEPGNYRVYAAAVNSAGWSKLRWAAFRVVAPRQKPDRRRPAKHH